MAINDKDFYASHGLDFDYKNMLEEYIKGVTKQAKIEVLTELQTEIEELPMYYDPLDISDLIQQRINALTEDKDKQKEVIAILTEIQLEMQGIKECEQQIYGKDSWGFVGKCQDVIQSKIDKLEGSADV